MGSIYIGIGCELNVMSIGKKGANGTQNLLFFRMPFD